MRFIIIEPDMDVFMTNSEEIARKFAADTDNIVILINSRNGDDPPEHKILDKEANATIEIRKVF